jgi:hypothetical protein
MPPTTRPAITNWSKATLPHLARRPACPDCRSDDEGGARCCQATLRVLTCQGAGALGRRAWSGVDEAPDDQHTRPLVLHSTWSPPVLRGRRLAESRSPCSVRVRRPRSRGRERVARPWHDRRAVARHRCELVRGIRRRERFRLRRPPPAEEAIVPAPALTPGIRLAAGGEIRSSRTRLFYSSRNAGPFSCGSQLQRVTRMHLNQAAMSVPPRSIYQLTTTRVRPRFMMRQCGLSPWPSLCDVTRNVGK